MKLKVDPTSVTQAGSRQVPESLGADADLAIGDNLPALCWTADPDGTAIWFNRRWHEYTGTSPDTQPRRDWHGMVDPAERDLVVETWRGAIQSGEPMAMNCSLRGSDGTCRPFFMRAEARRNQSGEIVRWFATAIDLSPQVDAGSALRSPPDLFRTLSEAMPNHVWVAAPSGALVWVNSRIHEYGGDQPSDMLGDGWTKMVHADDLRSVGEKWLKSLSTGDIYEVEFRLRRHDGMYRWFIARAVPVHDRAGRIVQWIGTNTDIDEQKKVARAHWESERRFALSQNAARIASLELDIASGTVVGSDNFWNIWGLSPRESVHISTLENIVVPEDKEVRSTPDTRREGTALRDVEYRIRRPDNGQIRWLSRSIDFVHDEKGTPVKMFGIIQDITDRKTIELSVRESEERYRSALIVGRMGSWETNFVTRQRIWSPEGQALFGLSLPAGMGQVGGASDEYYLAMHPDDRHIVKELHDLCNKVDSFPANYRVVRPDGTVAWLSGRGQVFSRTPDGRCERLVSVMADVTEQRRSEQHVRFLMREMSHRSKNLLAIIQAIARQTMRNSASQPEFQSKFGDRLRGLAASHDILVEQEWHGADLAELVKRHLTPFVEAGSTRLVVSGPSIHLNSNAAQSIGLALHELATNAVKYGALSVPAGRVSVSWDVRPGEGNAEAFAFCWTERDGPRVEPPTRKGFGNEVIARLVPSTLKGEVVVDYRPEGLELCLTVPDIALLLHGAATD